MKKRLHLLIWTGLVIFNSCGTGFLDVRPDVRQVVPKTIADYQAILDYQSVFIEQPSVELGVIGADEYYLRDGMLTTLTTPFHRNGYIWAQDVYEGQEIRDWRFGYQRILYANMALDVEKITPAPNEKEAWDNVKGSALFFRAYSLYQLAQLFCKPYAASTSGNDLGIPLPLDYDVSQPSTRGTVADVYRQILSDLLSAVDLLPTKALNTFRPSKAAACVLLARTYLQMGDFEKALYHADLGLTLNSDLIDFNNLDLNATYTFPMDYGSSNPEVIFYMRIAALTVVAAGRFNADTALLTAYQPTDLRMHAYFFENTDGRILFKGSYYGGSSYFGGLAVDELWLMRAECSARLGDVQGAMDDLNELLIHRHDREQFVSLTASDPEEALDIILLERRKELFMRGIRWEDLRRLNKEPRFAKTLIREIDGQRYELPPGDPRWVWPIPDNEIDLSGFPQNDR